MEGRPISIEGLTLFMFNDETQIFEIKWSKIPDAVAVSGYWMTNRYVEAAIFCVVQALVVLMTHPDAPGMTEWDEMIEDALSGEAAYVGGGASMEEAINRVREMAKKRGHDDDA